MKTPTNQHQEAGLAPGLDIIANAEHTLATCWAKHDPTEQAGCAHRLFLGVLEQHLDDLDVGDLWDALDGADGVVPHDDLAEDVRRALATGIVLDRPRTPWTELQTVDKASREVRSQVVATAIGALARKVAEILGPSPQAEAFARRWICYAIEEFKAR